MTIFPRLMITVCGLMLLTILTLAGLRLLPTHPETGEGIGAAVGIAINLLLQKGLWSKPATR